jgi:hypothetical protein
MCRVSDDHTLRVWPFLSEKKEPLASASCQLISKKTCLIGESRVGKNSLVRRFVERQFSNLIDHEALTKLVQQVELKEWERVSGIYHTSAKTGSGVDEIFQNLAYRSLKLL